MVTFTKPFLLNGIGRMLPQFETAGGMAIDALSRKATREGISTGKI